MNTENIRTVADFLQLRNYQGNEMLCHLDTGNVHIAKDWAELFIHDDAKSLQDFERLIDISKDGWEMEAVFAETA